MRKPAKLLLITIFLFIPNCFSSAISAESHKQNKELAQRSEELRKERELEYRTSVEKRMFDSLISKPSVKWLLTGFLEDQITYESTGDQNAVSPKGALGIAQFLPTTWEWMIDTHLIPAWFDIYNSRHQSIAQLIYMDHLYQLWKGHINDRKALTVASYDAGAGTVYDIVKQYGDNWKDYLPNETKNYLDYFKIYV